jgi:hypothetical protein
MYEIIFRKIIELIKSNKNSIENDKYIEYILPKDSSLTNVVSIIIHYYYNNLIEFNHLDEKNVLKKSFLHNLDDETIFNLYEFLLKENFKQDFEF